MDGPAVEGAKKAARALGLFEHEGEQAEEA
jgi:hypothetical protein